jgi:hypothetical protein
MIKYSSEIKTIIFDSFINSIEFDYSKDWTQNTHYYKGDQVITNNKKYVALNTGISGNFIPKHLSSSYSDGTITWMFIENTNYTNIYQKNLYLGIGKMTEWDNETIPDTVVIDDSNRLATINDLAFLKRIYKSDIAFIVIKNEWVNGTNYNSYDCTDNTIEKTYCTVIDSDGNILFYRCIDKVATNTVSTYQPTGESVNNIILSDTYVWKFIGKIPSTTKIKFATSTHYPIIRNNINPQFNSINKLTSFMASGVFGNTDIITYSAISLANNTSGTGLVIDSSLNVLNGGENYYQDTFIAINKISMNGKNAHGNVSITNGVITNITIDNQGTGYHQLDNSNNVIPVYGYIIGDGTGATVTVNKDNSGHIIGVDIVTGGQNYTIAKLVILHGKSVICRIELQPYGGHGYNLITELNSTQICLVTSLLNSNEYISGLVNQNFRQISIITDILDINNVFCRKEWYIAPTHINWNSTSKNKINPLTGKILYLNNRLLYQISENQTENIKITLSL